jgi:hypothetical protein
MVNTTNTRGSSTPKGSPVPSVARQWDEYANAEVSAQDIWKSLFVLTGGEATDWITRLFELTVLDFFFCQQILFLAS